MLGQGITGRQRFENLTLLDLQAQFIAIRMDNLESRRRKDPENAVIRLLQQFLPFDAVLLPGMVKDVLPRVAWLSYLIAPNTCIGPMILDALNDASSKSIHYTVLLDIL
jgi:hypothetical protein